MTEVHDARPAPDPVDGGDDPAADGGGPTRGCRRRPARGCRPGPGRLVDRDSAASAGASWESVATGLVVASCVTFVLVTVHPGLILTENTPTGGDMGVPRVGARCT